MAELHRGVTEKYPETNISVWGISHSGHQMDDLDPKLFPGLKDNPDLYSLEGQFNHKFEFTKTYIPSHIKVIGIGHSIGCKTWSELMKRIDVAKSVNAGQKDMEFPEIIKCFMLFPTLERMRATPNGKFFSTFLPYETYIDSFLKLIMMLPTAFHKMVLKIVFLGRNVPKALQDVTLTLFKPLVFYKVIHMAKCELEQVWDLDIHTLQSNLDKLFFYFGTTDEWVPLEYVEDMKNKLPNMDYQVCEKGMEHAFVIKDSALMAETICSLIDITAL